MLAQLLLNPEQLVVLGQPLRAAWSTRLDLASGQTHCQVSDEAVLGLTRPVAGHHTPASSLGHADGLNGLGHGTNLVHLEQQGVDALSLNAPLHAAGVRDQHVITHNLTQVLRGEPGSGLPVVLLKGVLNTYDGVLLAEVAVQVQHLSGGLLLGAVVGGVLEVEVVHLVLRHELRGSNVHADLDLAGVASLLDGVVNKVQALLVGGDVGGKATLVTHVASVLAVLRLDQGLQVVVDLAAHAHGLSKRGGTSGQNHELLHGQSIASVAATVDDVEGGDGQDQLAVASEISNVLIQGNTLLSSTSLGHSQRHSQDGVGTQLALVISAIKLLHLVIELLLVHWVHALQSRGDDNVDVLNSLRYTLAQVL
mmetsp:Transcript_27595/g.60369  ORF Transcript_27595/g.60369 Transcript_27595/m.60369 type:complete len:366 (-) Transcript_27595:454-1551(-)